MIEVVICEFSFQSPWHVGTGAESARADAVVASEQGKPVIPGSHIKGLARDVALQLLNDVIPDATHEVYSTFGAPAGASPRTGVWSVGSARAKPEEEGEVVVRQHNRMDPDTRRVPDDFYFNSEVVLPTVSFVARVRPLQEPTPAQLAVLCVGLLGIERIGKRRSRGWGHCRTTLRVVLRTSTGSADLSMEDALAPLFAGVEQ
jgi:hypothetical protein